MCLHRLYCFTGFCSMHILLYWLVHSIAMGLHHFSDLVHDTNHTFHISRFFLANMSPVCGLHVAAECKWVPEVTSLLAVVSSTCWVFMNGKREFEILGRDQQR